MDNWLSNLAIKALRICRLNKEAAGNHRQDMTGPVLEQLKQDGYTQVTWNSNGSRHAPCRDLNRQVWDLEDFLNTTEYDAPLFSRSHPGDESCTLTVSGSGMLPVEVDSYGETDEGIGVGRPVREEPKPKVKPLAPKVQPQVVEKPIPPKQKKIVYIPEEVHKQIKDPFEKQQLSDEEKEDWLKDLDKENVEEELPPLPPKKELTEEEWDEIRDFNVETSKKIPHWITGLFKK
jgi:hypothetical protein